ncbi:MAG: DNA alkylation repair protein [Defluviitaleaceae bacterium]|nr:DNA alkylation repair protein [Defluviitaleaceae bacterium]
MSALKDWYTKEALEGFAKDIKKAYAHFDANAFVADIMSDGWGQLELKGRWRRITLCMGKHLPSGYKDALAVLYDVIEHYEGYTNGFSIIFTDFIEEFGLADEDWAISIAACEHFTKYGTAEGAVRPFIIKDEKRMMAQMYEWSKSDNEHVRRLASEGCRPALPWFMALPSFKKDPTPILPILEELKTDPSLYVRKSVANNINDISKTHPQLMIDLAKKWHGKDKNTDWIVKHGLRTLLKKGNKDALAIFGYDDETSIEAANFALSMPSVAIGDDIGFSFTIASKNATKVRLEYAIDFVKAGGKRSRKVFKISEIEMAAGDKKDYVKKHSMADLSTRKHHAGTHTIALIINGIERASADFDLV